METTIKDNSIADSSQRMRAWFDDLIGKLRADEVLLENNMATEGQKQFYNTLISGSENEIHASARNSSSLYFIKNLVFDYFNDLKAYNSHPLKLALDLSDAKILVWAEVDDDDEATEDALILAEAKANAKYSDYGFHISSTIIEKSDRLPVPPHYHQLLLKTGQEAADGKFSGACKPGKKEFRVLSSDK